MAIPLGPGHVCLARNVEMRSLPAGIKVIGDATATLSCPSRDVRIPNSRSVLVISDLVTGSQLRQIALEPGAQCDGYRFTIDGRYALEEILTTRLGAQRGWRATELSSGHAYQFATPPVRHFAGACRVGSMDRHAAGRKRRRHCLRGRWTGGASGRREARGNR